MDMINFLISNCYFSFKDRCYKQEIGIPMGTSCAPFLANFYLFWYEFSYMKQKMKTDRLKCKKLRYIYRYIDDITVINDSGFFDKNFSQIYPKNLNLEKINSTSIQADVLDLNINIDNKKGTIKLYDKREFFPFKAINFPNYLSNVSKKMCMNVISNEIHRLYMIFSKESDWIEKLETFFSDLKDINYPKNIIEESINNFIKRNKVNKDMTHEKTLLYKALE